MSNRHRSRNAYESTLDGGITAGATSFSVASATGLIAPVYLCIDPDSPTKREFIEVTAISVDTFTTVVRGRDGSASGAQAHNSGITVRAIPVHQNLDHIFTDIEALEAAPPAHALVGAEHTAAGLTTGHVVRASGATTFAFAQLLHADLGSVGTDDHHAKLHQADHQSGGADALTGLLDATARVSVSKNSAADVGARRTLNFIEGGLVTLTIVDDAGGEEVDITIDVAEGSINHGSIAGILDDDHTQYLRADGTRGVTGSLDPATDVTDDLGTATATWRRLYADDIYDRAGAQTVNVQARQLLGGAWDVGGDLLPDTDFTHDLGSATFTWSGLYVDDIFDRGGTKNIDVQVRQLLGGAWDVGGALLPDTDNAHNLGSSSFNWLNLFLKGDINYAGAGQFNIDVETADQDLVLRIHNGTSIQNRLQIDGGLDNIFLYDHDGGRILKVTKTATNITRILGVDDTDGFIIDSAAGNLDFLINSVVVARFEEKSGTANSILHLLDQLENTGNVETLRLNELDTGVLAPVGWNSSSEKFKTDIVDLDTVWDLAWVDQIRPVFYNREGVKIGDVVQTSWHEISFVLEELAAVSGDANMGRFLTTSGDRVGLEPDERALLAVDTLAIQDLRRRVAALEAA